MKDKKPLEIPDRLYILIEEKKCERYGGVFSQIDKQIEYVNGQLDTIEIIEEWLKTLKIKVMDDNQRSAMFNAWKGSKKWIDVKMTNLENGKWEASCEVETLVRDTKAQAIYAISGNLSYKGYEISNLAEIQGL